MNGYNLELLEYMNSDISIQDFKEKMNREFDLLLRVLKDGVI